MKNLFLIVIGFVVMNSASALACSCAQPLSPLESLKQATAVFSGRVTNITETSEPSFLRKRITIAIDKKWKGIPWINEVKVSTAGNGAACGVHFVQGESYLIYSFLNGEGILTTNLCSRTKPLSQAQEDLKDLGPGETDN